MFFERVHGMGYASSPVFCVAQRGLIEKIVTLE